jgi:hypothetical protein
MQKLLTAFAAASALTFCATAAQADCYGDHNVTASKAPAEESVSMSTYDGALVPPATEEAAETSEAAPPPCAEGDKDCADGTK